MLLGLIPVLYLRLLGLILLGQIPVSAYSCFVTQTVRANSCFATLTVRADSVRADSVRTDSCFATQTARADSVRAKYSRADSVRASSITPFETCLRFKRTP